MTLSGNTLVTPTLTAVDVGDAVLGCFNMNAKSLILSSVTDNAGGNTYNVATLNYTGFGEMCWYWGRNILGSPTVFTFNFASPPVACPLNQDEYADVIAFNATAGPTEVDSLNPSLNITSAVFSCMVWAGIINFDSTLPTVPTGFTLRQIHSGTGIETADKPGVPNSTLSVGWTSTGTPANQNQLMNIAMQGATIIVHNENVKSGQSRVFLKAGSFRDEFVPKPAKSVFADFDLASPRKWPMPSRAWARFDQQEHPTWNAVLQPKLQSWELPAQFPWRWIQPRAQAPASEQFLTAQSFGFDLINQVRAFFSFNRPAQPDSTIRAALSAAITDGELLARRLWIEPRAQFTFEVKPQSPVSITDREQFPARLEFRPRVQQIEAFFIAAASQILQLTLAAWIWAAHASILGFTMTGSLVSWLWKANIALLVQTLNLVLVAWVWKTFAAVLLQIMTATHAVWKWLPQAPVLLFMLVASAPGVVWRWLAQAPGFFFPIILLAAQVVWLWIGRALVGGTHFAKVIYGLLQQVGRLRNR